MLAAWRLVGAAPRAAAEATATTAATTAVVAAASGAAALFAGPGLVDCQGSALELLAVERLNGLLGLGVVLHLDEAEAPRPAGLPIGNHLGARHHAMLLEESQQVVGACVPHQVADVNILRHLQKPLGAAKKNGPRMRTLRVS